MKLICQHSRIRLGMRLQARPSASQKHIGPKWRHNQGVQRPCHGHILKQPLKAACQRCQKRCAHLRCQSSSEGKDAAHSFRVTLSSEEVAALQFGDAREGDNSYCIVITDVQPSSRAEQEGIQVRQKLLAFSSPMQSGEMWPVNDKPSVRFVREAIGKLRRTPSVDLELTREPVPLESEREPNETPALQSSLMQSVEDADAEARTSPTIAERLAAAYEENEKTAFQEQSLRARRIKRRQDYLEAESNRNDTPLILGLLAAFILPSLCILIYAFSSGYLDKLANNYTRF